MAKDHYRDVIIIFSCQKEKGRVTLMHAMWVVIMYMARQIAFITSQEGNINASGAMIGMYLNNT